MCELLEIINKMKFIWEFLFSLGTKSLQEILSDRESIAQTMQVNLLANFLFEWKQKWRFDLGCSRWRNRMLGSACRTCWSVRRLFKFQIQLSSLFLVKMSDYLFNFKGIYSIISVHLSFFVLLLLELWPPKQKQHEKLVLK